MINKLPKCAKNVTNFAYAFYHPWEGSCQNREKVTDQFLRKLSKEQKGHKFGPFDL